MLSKRTEKFQYASYIVFYPLPRCQFLATLGEKMLAGFQLVHLDLCCAKKEDRPRSLRSGK